MALRVLIISQMYPSLPNKNRGIFVHKQAKELIKQGCDVRVVMPVPSVPYFIKIFSRKWENYFKIPLKFNFEGVEIYCPRYVDFPRALFFSFSGERMYRGIKNVISDLYEKFKFDIIHAHTILPAGYAGMEIKKEYKKPLIITVHGADFQKTIFKNKRCQDAVKKVIKFSQKIIVVSNKLKKIGEERLGIKKNKIEVIANGISKEDIFKGKSNLLRKYKEKKVILSVSNLVKTKGLDFNLKAIKKLEKKYPNLIYLMIGEGKERKALKKLIKLLKLEDEVELLGQLPHKKVMEYISVCDIFSLPSWQEGFGIVYLEAMAQEKPVIACKGEGAEDFIQDKKTGILVRPKDVDSLAVAMDFLLSNPKKAKEIGKNAKRLILENYTLEKAAKKIINIYNHLLNNL